MSLPKAKDPMGSLRSQHKSVKNCSCKKLKSASSHHSRQQLVDATLGRREKEQQVHGSAILAILLIQTREFQVIANRKKLRYRDAVPRTREGNSPIPVPSDSVPPASAMRGLHLRVKKDGTLPTNPTDYFNFVVDTCWKASAPVLTMQIS